MAFTYNTEAYMKIFCEVNLAIFIKITNAHAL